MISRDANLHAKDVMISLLVYTNIMAPTTATAAKVVSMIMALLGGNI